MIQYSMGKATSYSDIEKRLSDCGYHVGIRLLEIISFREKNMKRELKLIGMLSFISSTVWKTLFGKNADSLERSTDNNDECKPQKKRKHCFGLVFPHPKATKKKNKKRHDK